MIDINKTVPAPPSPILREPMPLVKVLSKLFPDAEFVARGKNYSSISSTPKLDTLISETELLEKQLEFTKAEWITILCTEANVWQEHASSYLTFSANGYSQSQLTLYAQKHAKASSYLNALRLYEGTPKEALENVTVPAMLLEESRLTGDDPYYLAQSIESNYVSTTEILTAFYGKIEGERRLVKRRILECNSMENLLNIVWAEWPEFQMPNIDGD
tara:strand:+ start:874 stop:1521 length:648 start_codon:yes stop_codon:yes gene_type:complete